MNRGDIVRLHLALVLGCTLAGCTPSDPQETGDAPADTVSQAARDSAVARSGLPGASVVGRAQGVSEAAQERAAQMDTIR